MNIHEICTEIMHILTFMPRSVSEHEIVAWVRAVAPDTEKYWIIGCLTILFENHEIGRFNDNNQYFYFIKG